MLALTHFALLCQPMEPADSCLRRHSPVDRGLNAKNNRRDTRRCCAHFSRALAPRLVWLTSQTVNGLTNKGGSLAIFPPEGVQQTQVLPINFGWAIAERVNPLERTTHARLSGVIMLHYRKHLRGGTPDNHYCLLVAGI